MHHFKVRCGQQGVKSWGDAPWLLHTFHFHLMLAKSTAIPAQCVTIRLLPGAQIAAILLK
jgi:hypothetical protein